MKRFNQMTETQMSQTNGGCMVCVLLVGATLCAIATMVLAGVELFSDKSG